MICKVTILLIRFFYKFLKHNLFEIRILCEIDSIFDQNSVKQSSDITHNITFWYKMLTFCFVLVQPQLDYGFSWDYFKECSLVTLVNTHRMHLHWIWITNSTFVPAKYIMVCYCFFLLLPIRRHWPSTIPFFFKQQFFFK